MKTETNRSPFEIRTRMLEMAQEYLQTQYTMNLEFAKSAFVEAVKSGMATQKDFESYMPDMFAFDEIEAKAQELYKFVSNVHGKKV